MPRKKSNDSGSPAKSLRKRAEAKYRKKPNAGKMTAAEALRLVEELEIHQIELEIQNEELRNAQVELAESRDRYSDLYEFAPVGYVTLNKDGTILESNLTAASMLGVARRALLRTNFSKLVVRESQDEWHLQRQAAFSGATKHTCEIEMQKPDRTRFTIRLEGIVSGPDDSRHYRMAFIDVTEQKAAIKALTELHKTLERQVRDQTAQIRLQSEAIAHLGEGVLIAEGADWAESRIVFVNEAMCRTTGYTAGELIGQPQRLLQGSPADDEILNRIRRELNAGYACRAELVNCRKDGTTYHAALFITPLLDAGGRPINFVSIYRDITARKQTERELDQYRKNLQTMSSELMLTEERERRRLAQDLHDGLGQALFRLRLQLDQGIATDDAVRQIGTILDEVGRMVNSVTFELSPPVLQLGLRAAIHWLARHMKERYALPVRIVEDGQNVTLDEGVTMVLFRSVRELLINVAKHARTGSAVVSLQKLERTLQVKVEDQGRGFDPAIASRHIEGRHFGLFSVREGLEYLDGTIQIQSAPGQGTSVTLTVPLAANAAKAKSD